MPTLKQIAESAVATYTLSAISTDGRTLRFDSSNGGQRDYNKSLICAALLDGRAKAIGDNAFQWDSTKFAKAEF